MALKQNPIVLAFLWVAAGGQWAAVASRSRYFAVGEVGNQCFAAAPAADSRCFDEQEQPESQSAAVESQVGLSVGQIVETAAAAAEILCFAVEVEAGSRYFAAELAGNQCSAAVFDSRYSAAGAVGSLCFAAEEAGIQCSAAVWAGSRYFAAYSVAGSRCSGDQGSTETQWFVLAPSPLSAAAGAAQATHRLFSEQLFPRMADPSTTVGVVAWMQMVCWPRSWMDPRAPRN